MQLSTEGVWVIIMMKGGHIYIYIIIYRPILFITCHAQIFIVYTYNTPFCRHDHYSTYTAVFCSSPASRVVSVTSSVAPTITVSL